MSTISLNQLLHSVADAGIELFRRRIPNKRSTPEDIAGWCEEIMSIVGEASGVAIARQIVTGYKGLNDKEKTVFLTCLLENFGVDSEKILDCAIEYNDKRDSESFERLFHEVEPRRLELFRRINMAPDGTSTLVSMRSDLLQLMKSQPALKPVEHDLSHIMASWFNKGFLSLRRIDWSSPAAILEKVIAYDTVHEITGWPDLRLRLAEDRRCFAFFHPAMPDEPLIFVEIALESGLPGSIKPLIDHNRKTESPEKADTAVFYSINNCHFGLKGISFGNFLIKQVVLEIKKEFPQVKTFATLSPVPKFRNWLKTAVADSDTELLSDTERHLLEELQSDTWYANEDVENSLRPILMRLVATYLVSAKKDKFPYDPVARFHLGNGARLQRINWRGDLSPNGLQQSAGILVNYLYDLDAIEKNHEKYVKDYSVVAGASITKLMRK